MHTHFALKYTYTIHTQAFFYYRRTFILHHSTLTQIHILHSKTHAHIHTHITRKYTRKQAFFYYRGAFKNSSSFCSCGGSSGKQQPLAALKGHNLGNFKMTVLLEQLSFFQDTLVCQNLIFTLTLHIFRL